MRDEEYLRSSQKVCPKYRKKEIFRSHRAIRVDNIKIGCIYMNWINLAKFKDLWLA